MRTWLLVSVGCICAALAGCGQAGESDAARRVEVRFATALAARDGTKACAQLSGMTVEALEEQEQAPCEQAVEELGLEPERVAGVHVYVTQAQVVYDDGEFALLDRGPDGWRLSAIGCRFEHGKPHDRPATCAAES
jgi:hypothetical protein